MSRSWLARAIAAGAALFAMAPVPALAQDPVVVDWCVGVDNFPSSPIGSAPSRADIAVRIEGASELAGEVLMVDVTGASGDVTGSGLLDMYGVAELGVPLFQYGPHTVIDLYLKDHPGIEHLGGVKKEGTFVLVFDVGDDEPTCDPDAMREDGAAAITTTTSTTTTTTTTTTIPEVVAPPPSASTVSTTTTTAVAAGEESPEPAEQPVDGRRNSIWLVPIAGGLVLMVAGGRLMGRREDDPGREELAA